MKMRIIAVGESALRLLARNKYRRRSKAAVRRLSERVGFDIRNLNRLSRLCYRFSHLLASIDSFTSFSPLANDPLGHHSDHSPFAQWSPETLGAGLILPFALTNSPHFRLRRTAHCADIRLLCHVGTWVRIPPAHFAKNENTPFGVFHFWRSGWDSNSRLCHNWVILRNVMNP